MSTRSTKTKGNDRRGGRHVVFDRRFFFIVIALFIPLLGGIFYMPWLLTEMFTPPYKNHGELGDLIGGTTAPFIAALGAILTFLAYWVQYKANEQQKVDIANQAEEIENQKKQSKIERFESQFHNGISIHRNNVSEFQLRSDVVGPKAFQSLFIELRFIHSFVYQEYHNTYSSLPDSVEIGEEMLYNIAYFFFFFGTDATQESMIINPFPVTYQAFVARIEGQIKRQQDNWSRGNQGRNMAYADSGGRRFTGVDTATAPGLGHSTYLGHYFRHLLQMVKSVHEFDSELLSYPEKYRYISVLRSQLSSYEQLLIYYNSLSVMGAPWLGSGETINYLKEYCIVRNIPLPLATFYKKPLHTLGYTNDHQKRIFDWTDMTDRIATLS